MSVLSLTAASAIAASLATGSAALGGATPQVITPPANAPGMGFFGGQVAIQGNEMFVGSPLSSEAGALVGAVYRYTRVPGGDWVFREFILPDFDTLPFLNFFGTSVSVDGDLLVVGAPRETDNSLGGFFQGAAYVFQFQPTPTGGSWTQIDRIGGATPLQFFGFDVAVSGDTVAVGAPGDADACKDIGGFCFSGAVYVHELGFSPCGLGAGACLTANGTPGCENPECCELVCALEPFCCDVEWDAMCAMLADDNCAAVDADGTCRDYSGVECVAQLFAPEPTQQEWVGRNIALDGGVLITGAHPFTDADKKAAPEDRTVAYIFERDAVVDPKQTYASGLWRTGEPIEIPEIEVTDGFIGPVEDVAISGDKALIGLYYEGEDETGGVWGLTRATETGAWIVSAELPKPFLEPFDQFGWAVDVRGDRAVVGAREVSVGGFFSGAAYTYEWDDDAGMWDLVEKLVPNDPGNGDDFGFSVALGEDGFGEDWVFVSAAELNEVYAFPRPFNDTFRDGDLYVVESAGPGVCAEDAAPKDVVLRVDPDTLRVERFAEVPCLDGRVATYDPFRQRLIVGVTGDLRALRQIDATGRTTTLTHNLNTSAEWGDRTIRAVASTGDGRIYCVGVGSAGTARIALINADDSVQLLADPGGDDNLFTETAADDLAMIYNSDQDALFLADSLGVATQLRRVRLQSAGQSVGAQTLAAFDAISDAGMELDFPTQFSAGPEGFLFLHVAGEATSMAEPRMQLISLTTLNDAEWASSQYTGVESEAAGTYSSLLGQAIVLDTANDQLRIFDRPEAGAGTTYVASGFSSAVIDGERAHIISIGDTISGGPESGPFAMLPPPGPHELGDDVIDIYTDTLLRIFEAWGPVGANPGATDLNRDGRVDHADLAIALRFPPR